jgi:hypothetical protein
LRNYDLDAGTLGPLSATLVDRKRTLGKVSVADGLEQAKKLGDETFRDQAWAFYGFWASETAAESRQATFPQSLEEMAHRHAQHSIDFTRVTVEASYGVRSAGPSIAETADLHPSVRDLFAPNPKLAPGELEAVAVMRVVGSPRPDEDRQLLFQVLRHQRTLKYLHHARERRERLERRAAEGDPDAMLRVIDNENAIAAAYETTLAQLDIDSAYAEIRRRGIRPTQFIKAPLDSARAVPAQPSHPPKQTSSPPPAPDADAVARIRRALDSRTTPTQ